MFTINDLLRDTSLESSIVFFSEEHREYKACNLVTNSYTPNDSTLWIADAQFVDISCANGEGILFVCRTEPEEQDLKMVDLICKALALAMEKDPKIFNYATDICQSNYLI